MVHHTKWEHGTQDYELIHVGVRHMQKNPINTQNCVGYLDVTTEQFIKPVICPIENEWFKDDFQNL